MPMGKMAPIFLHFYQMVWSVSELSNFNAHCLNVQFTLESFPLAPSSAHTLRARWKWMGWQQILPALLERFLMFVLISIKDNRPISTVYGQIHIWSCYLISLSAEHDIYTVGDRKKTQTNDKTSNIEHQLTNTFFIYIFVPSPPSILAITPFRSIPSSSCMLFNHFCCSS